MTNRISMSSDLSTISPENVTDAYIYRIEFMITNLSDLTIEVNIYIYIYY